MKNASKQPNRHASKDDDVNKMNKTAVDKDKK